MRKLIILLAALTLVAPLMFYGCGDDGDTGPAGAQGTPGVPGGPGTGIVAEETCVLCHGAGKTENVDSVHRIGQTAGTMTVTINSVTFGAPGVDNNVDVTVDFTFAATNSAGDNITNKINLEQPASNTTALPNNSTDNLAWIRFSLAQLNPGQNGSPDEWGGFVVSPGATGSGPFSTANRNGINGAVFAYDNTTGEGSYTFRDNVIKTPDFKDNLVTRAFIQVSGVTITLFTSDPYFNAEGRRRPVANAVFDVVPNGDPVNLFKNDVSTAACNACHDPLAIHGGGRREYKACQVCHNAKLETLQTLENDGSLVPNDNLNLVNLVHKIHNDAGGDRFTGVQDIGEFAGSEHITYPQAINNCTTCHQGPAAADNTYNNFQNRPSRLACGACHFKVDFATGTGHDGGAQADDSGCGSSSACHTPARILAHHAPEETPPSPNNPTPAAGLKVVEYAINSVTVDNTNAAIVKFQIKIDNVVANLGNAGDNVARPSGFSTASQPSFLTAYTQEQDGVSEPADYTNSGRRAGQPRSVSIIGLPITANDNTWTTVKIANAFPAGAKMRAVALQGYLTQINGTDNVARHTPSVQKAVTGDTVRRTVVKSGYTTDNKPEGCLECHEVFEGHGGNRVNNVQVCVMCHNPNLSTSGRIINPALYSASPINSDLADIIDFIDNDGDPATVGTDPLTYPEITNNFKELIHGIHARDIRGNEFVDIRGERLALIAGDEITYPGDVSHCTKCHVGTTYQNVQVPNILLTTEKITTGNPSEDNNAISAARDTVPNDTDLVNSATSSACGYCHNSSTAVSHFVAQGGNIKTKRAEAKVAPPPLMPDVGP